MLVCKRDRNDGIKKGRKCVSNEVSKREGEIVSKQVRERER